MFRVAVDKMLKENWSRKRERVGMLATVHGFPGPSWKCLAVFSITVVHKNFWVEEKWAVKTNIVALEGRVLKGDEVTLGVGRGRVMEREVKPKGCRALMVCRLGCPLWLVMVTLLATIDSLDMAGKCLRWDRSIES